MKELEVELGSSHNSIIELEEWVGDRKAEVAKKDEYIALLEERFAEAMATSLRQEG